MASNTNTQEKDFPFSDKEAAAILILYILLGVLVTVTLL
jgi:hypothetical protein